MYVIGLNYSLQNVSRQMSKWITCYFSYLCVKMEHIQSFYVQIIDNYEQLFVKIWIDYFNGFNMN